jgi:hypothetical protein
MSLAFEDTSHTESSLDEFVQDLSDVNFDNFDEIIALAPCFQGLLRANNLLVDTLNDELERAHKKHGTFSGQCFYMRKGVRYAIRINVWTPPPSDAALRQYHAYSDAYLIPHNHDFTLLTGGLFGPGYTTDLFEVTEASQPGERVDGRPGATISIADKGTAQLTPGTVMFYYPSTDIHLQRHPTSISASLNLLVLDNERAPRRPQFRFDTQTQRIVSLLNDQNDALYDFCSLAAAIGNDTTLDVLRPVALSHPIDSVRAMAMKSMEILEMNMQNRDAEVNA